MSKNRLDKDGLNAKQGPAARGARARAEGARRARFVDEYLKDLNAKQAAIRAGYSPHTAEVQGSRLLSHAKVGRIIGRRIEEPWGGNNGWVTVKADEVVERLRIHAFGTMAHYFEKTARLLEPHEMTPEALAGLSTIRVLRERTHVRAGDRDTTTRTVEQTIELKRWDPIRALELLGRHLGMWRNRHEHSADVTLLDALREIERREGERKQELAR